MKFDLKSFLPPNAVPKWTDHLPQTPTFTVEHLWVMAQINAKGFSHFHNKTRMTKWCERSTQSKGFVHFSHVLCQNPDCWRTEANPAHQRSPAKQNQPHFVGQHILGAASLPPQRWSLNNLCPQPAPAL